VTRREPRPVDGERLAQRSLSVGVPEDPAVVRPQRRQRDGQVDAGVAQDVALPARGGLEQRLGLGEPTLLAQDRA
jgi:hypothetical protein